MKNKISYYTQLYLLMTLFWIALFENVHMLTVVSGFLISIGVVKFTEKFLLKAHFYNVLNFNLFTLAIYFVILIYEIYSNAFKTIYQIISLQTNPDIVEIHTDLQTDTQKCILANSITLTPGTVTLDFEHQTLKVLWIDAKSKNSVIAGNLIKGNLEYFLNR